MNKIAVFLIALVALFGIYRLVSANTTPNPEVNGVSVEEADIVLFWGDGCPHCEVVEDFINNDNVDSKLKIVRKEVWKDRGNQQLMTEYAKKCPEIDTTQGMGVPFAYFNTIQKCQIGDTPIIDQIKQLLTQSE